MTTQEITGIRAVPIEMGHYPRTVVRYQVRIPIGQQGDGWWLTSHGWKRTADSRWKRSTLRHFATADDAFKAGLLAWGGITTVGDGPSKAAQ